MKVELLVARAVHVDGNAFGQSKGEVVDVDELEAKRLVETGQAKKVGRAKSVETKTDKAKK